MTSNSIPPYSHFFYFKVTSNYIPLYSQESKACCIFFWQPLMTFLLLKVLTSLSRLLLNILDNETTFLQLLASPKHFFKHTFLQYIEDFFIFVSSISCSSFANPNIISNSVFAWLVCSKTGGYKVLCTGGFLLTCWLKPNRVFFSGQPIIILSHRQVFGKNSQQRADDNNYFNAK